MSAQWRAEQQQCLRSIEEYQSADQAHLDEGIRILELAQREARRLLDFVVSDLIVETPAKAAHVGRGGRAEIVDREIWLGD
jgi:hypothetical protein